MKKTLCVIGGLGIVSGMVPNMVNAQTSVTAYGVVDVGVVNESGGAAGSVTKLTSGVASYSRLGFRGTEDLGGGYSALFVLESGFKADTGEIDAAGSLFNRQSFVGLKGSFGGLTLGRQYTPYYTTLTNVADPFGSGYAGSVKNMFPTAGNNTRTSNTIMYVTPMFSHFSGELAYSMGEQAGSASAGGQLGAAVTYADGPLTMRLVYSNRNNNTVSPAINLDHGKNTLLAANYNFGWIKAFAAYGIDQGFNSAPLANTNNPYGGVKATASTDSRDILLGATLPFGVQTVMVSYIRKNDRTSFNQNASQWALGYTYALSIRTTLYTSYAKISNKNGAGYTVGSNTETGSGDSAINFGVRHTF